MRKQKLKNFVWFFFTIGIGTFFLKFYKKGTRPFNKNRHSYVSTSKIWTLLIITLKILKVCTHIIKTLQKSHYVKTTIFPSLTILSTTNGSHKTAYNHTIKYPVKPYICKAPRFCTIKHPKIPSKFEIVMASTNGVALFAREGERSVLIGRWWEAGQVRLCAFEVWICV